MASQKTVLLIVLAIVGGVLLMSCTVCGVVGNFFVQGARQQTQTAACKHNLRQIMLAIQNHHDQRGDLPPLYIADAQGRKLHSWRVLLLPYLDQNNMFRQIRLNEPWDSEFNRQFHSQMPPIYRCPSSPFSVDSGMTSYFSIAGEDAPLRPFETASSDDDTIARYKSKTSFMSLTKGIYNQAMVYEANGYAVNWMDPVDPTFDELQMSQDPNQKGAGSAHPGVLHVGHADGRVVAVPAGTSVEELRRMLSNTP